MGWGYTSGRRGSKQEELLEWNYLVLERELFLSLLHICLVGASRFSAIIINHKIRGVRDGGLPPCFIDEEPNVQRGKLVC